MAKTDSFSCYIHLLDINGLRGRMVVLPAQHGADTEILFIHGRHSSLERWRPLLEYLRRFGRVTAPDLPGFGGMDSFYALGKKPTLDAYAGYLGAFMTLRFRRKRVVIVAEGFGFAAATRMLQRYPQICRQVVYVVALGGGLCHDDLTARPYRRLRMIRSRLLSGAITVRIARLLYLNHFMLPRLLAHQLPYAADPTSSDYQAAVSQELSLWAINDLRTHWYTASELLRFDNCGVQVPVQVWYVGFAGRTRAGWYELEQRLRVVFDDVTATETPMRTSDMVLLTDKLAAALLPSSLRRKLASVSGAASKK